MVVEVGLEAVAGEGPSEGGLHEEEEVGGRGASPSPPCRRGTPVGACPGEGRRGQVWGAVEVCLEEGAAVDHW